MFTRRAGALLIFGLSSLSLSAAPQPAPPNVSLPDGATAMLNLPITLSDLAPERFKGPETKRGPTQILPLPAGKKNFTVLALSPDGVSLWEPRNVRLHSFSQEPNPASRFWLAPDLTTLVTAHDRQLRIWEKINWSKPKPFAGLTPTVVESEGGRTGSFVASPDGSLLAVPTKQNVRILDLKRREWLAPLRPHVEPKVVAIAPNNRTVAVIGADSLLRVFSLSSRQSMQPADAELWRKRLPQNDLKYLAFSPDGLLVATASQGKTVLLETLTGRYHKSIDREFGEGDVTAMCFSPDGSLVASALGGDQSRIMVIDAVAGRTITKLKGHAGTITSMTFADADSLASAGGDGRLILWNLSSLKRPGIDLTTPKNAYQQLDSADVMTASAAVRSLISGGDSSVEVIRTGLDNSDEMQIKIGKWIAQLESDEFRPRELARKNLLESGAKCVKQLREALNKNPSPDVEACLKSVLIRFEKEDKLLPPDGLYGEALTRLRAVYVLEQIPGDKAKAVLEMIAKTTPDHRAGIEARMMLERRGK